MANMTFIRAVLTGGSARVTTLVFGFVSSIIVARVLGAELNGTVAYSIWLAGTAASIVDLGIPSALSRYGDGYRGGVDWKDQASRLFLPFALTTIAATIGFSIWGVVHHGMRNNDSAVFWFSTAALLLVTAFATFAAAVARSLRQVDLSSRDMLIGCLLQVPTVFAGAWFFGAPGAIFGYFLRSLPQALGLLRYIDLRRLRSIEIPSMVKVYARNSWLANLSNLLVWTRLEFVFIGFYCDNFQLGYYTVGLTLTSFMIQLPLQIADELVPFLGRYHDDSAHAEIAKLYQGVMQAMALLMFPLCLGGAAITPQLLVLLFGASFAPATHISELLLAMSAVSALATVPTIIIISRERTDIFVWASPIAGFAMVVALAVVVPFGAGFGAAVVRSTIHTLWFVGLAIFVRRAFKISVPFDALARTLVSALACAGVARLIVDEVPGAPGVVAAILSGAVVYLVLLRLTRAVGTVERDWIADVLDRSAPNAVRRILRGAVFLLAPRIRDAKR